MRTKNSKNYQAITDQWIVDLAKTHRELAKRGTWEGQGQTPYFDACRVMNPFRGIGTIFTRDVGYHTSGWFKNPDFERCEHLTVSYFDPESLMPLAQDHTLTMRIAKAIFFPNIKLALIETPHFQAGRERDVWHYRVFCDERWQPVKPQGEVYSTEFTEKGWKSFSEVRDAIERHGQNPNVSK